MNLQSQVIKLLLPALTNAISTITMASFRSTKNRKIIFVFAEVAFILITKADPDQRTTAMP